MAQVHCWNDLIAATIRLFPETNRNALLLARDNLGQLVREIALAHDLTLSEAAEMVVLRLPYYSPVECPVAVQRLSA